MIDKISVCGRDFDVTEIRKDLGDGNVQINFSVDIDGESRNLGLEYTTEMVEALSRMHGINAETELQSIVEGEIRLSAFSIVNKVNIIDITTGKRPDLIKEFVLEFGAGYIDSEVQEKYMNLISEVLGEQS